MCVNALGSMDAVCCISGEPLRNFSCYQSVRALLLHFLSQLKEQVTEQEKCKLCRFVQLKTVVRECVSHICVYIHIFCYSETYVGWKVVKLIASTKMAKDF